MGGARPGTRGLRFTIPRLSADWKKTWLVILIVAKRKEEADMLGVGGAAGGDARKKSRSANAGESDARGGTPRETPKALGASAFLEGRATTVKK